METYKVNFDLRGGLTMEEWIEQCLSPEEKAPKRRHAELREEQVDQLTGESGAIFSPRQATA